MSSCVARAIANLLRARVCGRAQIRCSSALFPWQDLALTARSPSRREFSIFYLQSSDVGDQEIDGGDALVAEKEASLGNLIEGNPDRVSTEDYLRVLRTLAVSRLPDAPRRAERWIHRLEQHAGDTANYAPEGPIRYFERPSDAAGRVVPTTECYKCVIEAWAGAIHEDPARVVTRAERWLWKHIESPSEDTRPDTACFNAFLDLCTKGRALKNSAGTNLIRDHAQKAENVLRYMISTRRKEGPGCRMSPNVVSFNLVIRGWTRCRKSFDIAERTMDALSLLEQYQSSVDASVRPDAKSFGMTMDSISVKAKLKVTRALHPSGSRNRSNHSENGLEEIQLLSNMIDFLHEKRNGGDVMSVAPSTFAYNILLACWANVAVLHEQAPLEAEKILRQMTSLKEQGVDGVGPDCTSYLMVMRAWANSSKPNRGQRITWLLSNQWNDYHFIGDANLRPTVDSYNTAIRAWISLMEPLEAERLLAELLQEANTCETGKLRANSESFSFLIRAWLAVAENGSEVALVAAARWLDTLEKREKAENGISSSVELFMLFLGAARKCAAHSRQVLDIAVDVFDKLRASRHMIDCLHYSRLLQIGLLTLSRDQDFVARISFIEHIVMECKEAGLVSTALLQALSNGPSYVDGWTVDESRRMVTELFPHWPLPASWMRNVRQEDQIPREKDLYRSSFSISHHGIDPFLYKH